MTDLPPPPPPMGPPPGYVAYGSGFDAGSYAGGGTFSRIGGLAKALVVLEAVVLLFNLIALLLQLGLSDAARDFRDDTISRGDFDDKVAPLLAVTVVTGAVAIAVLVIQCIWSFRMARNLQVLGRVGQTWKPGWGIAVWILAGCTLGILPYLMLRELWQGSDAETPPGDPTWKRGPVGTIVHTWFGLQLAGAVLGVIAGISAATYGLRNSSTSMAKSLDDRLPFVIGSGVLSVVVAGAFILVVRALTTRHVRATGEL